MNNSDLMGQLQQLLGDPDMANKLKGVLEELGGGRASEEPPVYQAPEESDLSEATQKIKQVYDRMNSGSDPRVSLLKALRPYMNHTRAAQLDTAVRILGLTKMSGLFQELQ
ncbi:MAG: hypothetical protein SO147_06115 [Clostridia bacterium]|nr:hypothetical protein [Clostridia bacterium]